MSSDSQNAPSFEPCSATSRRHSSDAIASTIDVSNTSASPAFVVTQPVSPCGFTAVENPYLFPSSLLDSFANEVDSNQPDDPCDSQDHRADTVSSIENIAGEDTPQWWLIHTKPRQEKKLAQQLGSIGIPHYLPVSKCKTVTRGRTRVARLPQFPSYLFLWADPYQRRIALQTNRIVANHFVGDQAGLGRQLWNLADLIEKGVPLRVEDRLAPGRLVRVKSGLLRDKTGVVIKRGGKTRLFVFVSELLGGVSVEIEQHFLEPY